MRASPDILVVFLLVSAFSILLLIFVIILVRLFKKKEQPVEHFEMNGVAGAFKALGNEIKSLKEQLIIKERLAALGEVSAGIAHELRNPMGVISGYAALLLKGLDESDGRREIVQGILNEVEEMNRVMEELLKFSRSEPLNKIDIDLSKLVRNVINDTEASGTAISFSISEAIAVKGDETLIRQAVRNLLHNAVQAGDRADVAIEKSVLSGREGVIISVKDNGKGIPESALNKIFMPFYTTKEKGLGIGLALVQKIAIAHGGNISVESREGQGSVFKLFLPAN